MSNRFIKFCTDINFTIPHDWEKNTIEPSGKNRVTSRYILIVTFFSLPKLSQLLDFEKCVENSEYNFELQFVFKNQFCGYEVILEYLKHICKNQNIFSFTFPWETVKVELDESNTYHFIITRLAQWESLEPKIPLIKEELFNFGLNQIKINFQFDYEQWDKTVKAQEQKILEVQKLSFNTLQNQTSNNEKAMSDFTYKNKKKYISLTIDECTTSFEKSVSVHGEIFKRDTIKTKSGGLIVILSISDFTNAIKIKIFCSNPEQIALAEKYIVGISILVNGQLSFDDYAKERIINSEKILQIDSLRKERQDVSDYKRVELSARTNMSAMDGIVSAKEYVAIAERLGHDSIAIVDTDSVQAFPEFYYATKNSSIKPIYGATFSVIERNNKAVINPLDISLQNQRFVIFDIETTGLSPRFNEIIEFGASIVENNKIVAKHQFFVKPTQEIPLEIVKMTGINAAMVENAIDQKTAIIKIIEILKDGIAVAHNAAFDIGFINEKIAFFNLEPLNIVTIDTLSVARMLNPKFKKNRLENLAHRLDINYDSTSAHRADYDADVLAKVWIHFLGQLFDKNIFRVLDLAQWIEPIFYNRQFPREISVLAKNQAGLKELFQLISQASTTNFHNGPRLFIEDLPKSQNLLIGSSGIKSRLIDKLLFSPKIDLFGEISHYDYIEIPPIQGFLHYFNRGLSQVDLQIALKELILEAKSQGKIVVAISDARYVDKEDSIIHEIYINSKGIGGSRHYLYKDSEDSPVYPLQYYLTTDEMKIQFQYLIDEDLIEEIVIDNPNKIAQMISDNIEIIKDKLYPPTFDDSHNKLEKLVWQNAQAIYGKNLPEIVEQRIHRELGPILKYGFDVVYWISHKLVSKSLEDGYLVGSRGSVGSSLVATMAGITEVNPLQPHYICPQCKKSEFFTNGEYQSGFDLPDKTCSQCLGVTLDKDGQTIPFETFLGFEADKVPDIDLNFSGEYQALVHDEVRKIFGIEHTFRAGTISKIADKTAYGYVKAFEEKRKRNYSNSFREFLVSKLTGVKRTTGQHPGGIIVIPKEFNVEDFTPINYPANDADSSWKTTHFDFHAIHDNVLKLDILGHDDPTAIKMLEELTSVKVSQIPKNDPKIISLFSSTEALGIKPEDISGETTGAQGIPEFGTVFVRQMLKAAKVTSFADLVSISGLSHGTDVWKGNAEKLIVEEGLTFKEVISCRDDIMSYLILKGLEPKLAFQIMEQVRKGQSVTTEQEAQMRDKMVPNWYIESMKKIKYMFPKAHATAYVMMAWRIAYYKLYHPLAYYATYFTTRADVSDIQTLIAGKNVITQRLQDLNSRQFVRNESQLSTKEKDLIPILAIAEEMYARGYKISNVQIGRSEAKRWIIDEQNRALIAPYTSIDGLGEAQADSIINALKSGPFLSIQDLSERTTLNQTLLKKMKELQILDDYDETNQITLF